MKRISRYLIFALLIVALIVSIRLVLKQWDVGSTCPPILSIPACYIILISVVIALLANMKVIGPRWFFIGAGIPFTLALIGTVLQITGDVHCPQTGSGIPMCFLSLSLFSTILTLHFFNSKQ